MSKRNCRNCGNLNLCSLAKKTYELDGMLTLVTTEYNEEAFDKAPNLIVDLLSDLLPEQCNRYIPKKPERPPLTAKRARLFKAVRDYQEKNGFIPTVRILAKRLKVSPATIQEHINRLRADGYIQEHRIGVIV
jgi:hypothetical protein